MRTADEHAGERLLHSMERTLQATRRLVSEPIDGRLAHEYLAAREGEGEARAAFAGGSGLAPRAREMDRAPEHAHRSES